MAIRFVDKEPEAPRDKPRIAARDAMAPAPGIEADAAISAAPPALVPSDAERELPELAHAKPAPKTRGRKAHAPAAHVEAGSTSEHGRHEPAESGDVLLPGLQVHAKPTPKPRGRKKAFG